MGTASTSKSPTSGTKKPALGIASIALSITGTLLPAWIISGVSGFEGWGPTVAAIIFGAGSLLIGLILAIVSLVRSEKPVLIPMIALAIPAILLLLFLTGAVKL